MNLREFIERCQEVAELDPTRLDLEVRIHGARDSTPLVRYTSGLGQDKASFPYINVWNAK